jgi:HK97 family phage major capsid protein
MSAPTLIELREQLLEHGDRIRELRQRGRDERTTNWSQDIRETRDIIYALDAEMRIAEMAANLPGPSAGTLNFDRPEFRTAGELFTQHDDFSEWVKRGARGSSPGVEIERRNLLSTVVSGDGASMLPKGSPFIEAGALSRRRLFIRDVIAGGSTTLNSIPYVRELNPRANEGGASAVPEASAKPEVVMQFDPDDAPVRTIAAWIPVTMQVLEDIPTMRSYVDGRLGYMIALREEEEMLNGPGTGARVRGILQQSGRQTQSFVTDRPTTIGRAVGLVENVDGEADGIAINPVEFWSMATTRYSTQFDGTGGSTSNASPFGAPPATLWGLPVVRSRSVAVNKAVVGAWRMGAQVFDRSTVQIRVTDSHSDFFTSNRLVILAESRLALAVHRPDFFVECTLS